MLQYDPSSDRLWLEAGTGSGAVGFFPVDSSGSGPAVQPLAALSGSHSAVRYMYFLYQHVAARLRCSCMKNPLTTFLLHVRTMRRIVLSWNRCTVDCTHHLMPLEVQRRC